MVYPTIQPIAIVGIAADLPSGTHSDNNFDHSSFFEFLLHSGEAYERIPTSRFDTEVWKGKGLGQVSVEHGSFLKDIDLFDHVEFGISSRDARAMAPATRSLIEQSFLALLDSGIDYRKQPIGCYMSGTSIDLLTASQLDPYEPRGSFAAAPAMIANRVSNHLDLLGPSIPVDTACSSSQTAFHLAVQAILHGDCKAAIVGGCQLNHRLTEWVSYSQSGVLSADGKCKPFDASADGFGRAEGCVVVVIKLLEDALRDNDQIYATILGTSSNSTGAGGPPGAPVAEYQYQAMKLAFERAGRKPTEVDYVELHATGTAKGDPTEVNWVGKSFRRPTELLVGSVKGNIGHTEITAFLVSLSKVISIFQHRMIPPNVNLSVPNPAIKWQEYNLRVPVHPTPLSPSGNPTLISLASSGIGGSNGHVVLESAPPPPSFTRSEQQIAGPVLLMAAGLSPRSASTIAEHITEILDTAPRSEYPAASTTLGRRAKQMNWRSYAVATPGSAISFSTPQYSGRDKNPVVFVFSGQGPQHENMGQELFAKFPVFRNSILEMDAVFERKTGKSMITDYGLFDATSSATFEFPTVWPISLTLPAIAMFQMALFDLLVSLGVRPDIVLGHSAGETALLYASGAGPQALALELAIIRGGIFATVETLGGTMAALSCGVEEVERLLSQHRSISPGSEFVVEVACLNSPTAVALSGHEQSIDEVLAMAQEEGILGRKIRTRVPIHSSMMEVCKDRYRKEVQELFARYPGPHLPQISTYSTLTGYSFDGPLDAEYFWMNTRGQVLFAPVIQSLVASATFVEIAPHPVLSSYLSDMAPESSTVLSVVRRAKAGTPNREHHDILQLLGRLTAAGHNCVDFTLLNSATASELKLVFRAYPFLKKQFPLFPETREPTFHHGPINRSHLRLNRDTHPTLSEHVIRGEPIWPAAGFLEMALEFGATALFNVNFRSMLPLSTETPLPVNVTLDGSHWKVTSTLPVKAQADGNAERLHADGYLSLEPVSGRDDLDISEIRGRCDSHVESEFYPALSYFSAYGPKFQRVTNLYFNSNEALASIRGMDGSLLKEDTYILHPAILDACVQITAYRPFHGDFAPNNYYLPSHIGEVILYQPPKTGYFPAHIYAHVELIAWMPDSIHYNVAIVDDLGKHLCTLQNLQVAKHLISLPRKIASPLHIELQPVFHDSRISAQDKSEFFQDDLNDSDAVTAALITGVRLRKAILFSISHGHRGVMRIIVSGDADSILPHVVEVLSEFPQTAFELSTPETRAFAGDIDHPFTVIRRYKDWPIESYFDLALSFASDPELDPGSVIKACDDVLVPGGTIILTGLDPTFHFDECHGALERLQYSVVHANHFPRVDPVHFTIDAQKAIWKPEAVIQPALFDEDTFVFTYVFGDEAQLQWDFSGLNPSQALDIWILAADGPDTSAGLGLVRALRREYLFWTIRFLSFPERFSKEMQLDALRALPPCLRDELDVIFSSQGEPLVPRLAPIVTDSSLHTAAPTTSISIPVPPNHALVDIHQSHAYPELVAFAASVKQVNANDLAEYPQGSLVLGLQHDTHSTSATTHQAVIELGSTCVLPNAAAVGDLLNRLPGLVVSILAPGSSTFTRSHRLRSLSILVTHCDDIIGSTVSAIYLREGITFSRARRDTSILDLSRLGRGSFDLIVSGYEDTAHVQVLRTLLQPLVGKLFLWCHELPRRLLEDPCAIGDALSLAISKESLQINEKPTGTESDAFKADFEPQSVALGTVFHPNKTYVILGGIGSLGAAVALFMVQHGARRIVVTSRSGSASLVKPANRLVQRIFTYLQSIPAVDIRLEAADATSPTAMQALFGSVGGEIGGCFILTAVLADGLFPTLSETEFGAVLASKTGVLQTLLKTLEASTLKLELIVAFSSMTAFVGTGGQTHYCAANAALEDQVRALPNGFSFVCPGILDSTLMDAGGTGSRLSHLTEWAISTDDMVLWLDDAISKFQNGARFHRYFPNIDWQTLDRTHGMPRMGAHLVHSTSGDAAAPSESEIVKASRIIQNVLNISEHDFDVEVPLTWYGVDSLSAGRLSFALRSIAEVTQLQLLADASLADIIRKFSRSLPDSVLAEQPELPGGKRTGDVAIMDDWVRNFKQNSAQLPVRRLLDSQTATSDHVILLTGSTGALGCHLLAQLLSDRDVKHVYALNRQVSGGLTLADRQATALERQGLPPVLVHSQKLTLLVGNFAEADFCITSGMMDELRSTVTHIIHNAWRVDFMAPLSEFESLVTGTRQLIQFAIESSAPVPISFSFISTIAVYQNVNPSTPAPEAPILDPKVAARSAYVESKWVAERLVQMASEEQHLNANVIRVGLLTGSPNGSWDTAHWVPALAQSAVHIGCLPDGDGPVSWLPINTAAAAIVEMRNSMNQTLHLIHPRPATWKTIMEPFASAMNVPLVPYAEWFARLRGTAEFAAGNVAALRLVDLFQFGLTPTVNKESMGLLPRVLSDRGTKAAPILLDEKLTPLGPTDVRKWVHYWRAVGFLPSVGTPCQVER
ncbi:putative polyketide synthase [Mycena filopes]|nr:putative polyketide synthase [Mycena filopes]